MKIVKIIGGLGNQMFQFALYKALQKQHPEERVLIDLHCFNGYHLHHGFEIGSVFGADYEEATLKEVARLAYPYPNYQTWRFGSRILPVRRTMLKEKADFAFEPSALTRQGDTYYDGYWQHEEYFKHIRKDIIELYQFKTFEDEQNKTITDKINSHECLSIHVRRGDYTNNHLYNNICTADYYKKAFLKMKEVCSFDMICIFSDDMEWCRQQFDSLKDTYPLEFITWNQGENSFRDLQLMSLCHHHIIANSSFSWWGAWLSRNQHQKICAPKVWMNIPEIHSPLLKDWILI